MNRTIEAFLKLSAKLGSMKAFGDVGAKFDDVSRKASRYNRQQTLVARGSSAMGLAVTRYLGPAAVGAATVQAVRLAGNFEEALFNVEKKAGATREQMEAVRGQVLSLAGEIPISINEIAAAFERGAAAGIPLEELAEFARLTTRVSSAWDMTAEEVGNVFAGFQAGMNIPMSELEQFADLINYLADSGISDEADIASFIDRVGASLQNLGLGPETIAAYGAALINLRMPAEVAARAMDTLIGKLAAPQNLSDKAFNALNKIVGDVKGFSESLADDPDEALMTFLRRLEGFSGQERIGLLGAFLGEGFDDEVARMVAGIQEIERNRGLIDNRDEYVGSIDDLSERRLELVNAQLQIAKNHLNEIAILLGANVAGPLADVLGALADKLAADAAADAAMTDAGLTWRERARVKLRGGDDMRDWTRKGGYIYEGDEDLAEQYRDLYRIVPDVEALRGAVGLTADGIGSSGDWPIPPERPLPVADRHFIFDRGLSLTPNAWGGAAPVPDELVPEEKVVVEPPYDFWVPDRSGADVDRAGPPETVGDPHYLRSLLPGDLPAPDALPGGWPHPVERPFSDGPVDLPDGLTLPDQPMTPENLLSPEELGLGVPLSPFARQAEIEALRADIEAAGQALADGGQDAGQAISDAAAPTGEEIGQTAAGALTGQAPAIGAAIGAAAADEIRDATDAALQRLDGAGFRYLGRPAPRANRGITMEDAGQPDG